MPLTVVWYNPKKIGDWLLERITERLPGIIAEALDVPEKKEFNLTKHEIEVVPEELSGKYDRNTMDLEVIIWAPECPERLITKDDRRRRICREIEEVIIEPSQTESYHGNKVNASEIKGYVYLLLQPASFGMLNFKSYGYK
jgi:hypothetical protein